MSRKLILSMIFGIFLGFVFSDVIESFIYYSVYNTSIGYKIIRLHHSTAGDIYWKVDHLITDDNFWVKYPGEKRLFGFLNY